MRYFEREVGLAMCHSTGPIGDTLIGPFYFSTEAQQKCHHFQFLWDKHVDRLV